YKAVEVARHLVKAGAEVQVAMSAGALEFVRPLTFEAVTSTPVLDDAWARRQGGITHVERAHGIDALLVAPASANTLARLASGFADDVLTAVALSTRAPMVLAPAMEHGMWNHPATQENLRRLCSWGATVVGPETGALASGRSGDGRLADPSLIAQETLAVAARGSAASQPLRDLHGEQVLITAGPTWERIDPVRILANRSTGAMGIALAEEAADRGAEVRLVLGPTHLAPRAHPRLEVARVESAQEMLTAAREELSRRTIVVGAAAVSDFRPAQPREQKWKRSSGDAAKLELVENPDIIATLSRELRASNPSAFMVGFAAETNDMVEHARAKLRKKGCDVIVANLVGPERGFGPGQTEVVVVEEEATQALGPGTKPEIARALWTVFAKKKEPSLE
ncbi:MAG: bifunctional phosphopantothenoylcysteine decarboxylase/phosphopantothenate--cysteine ligase CoaBC, partial [Myxococcota bacterium]